MDCVNYFCKKFVPLLGGVFMLKKLPLFIFIVVFFLITALAMEGIQDRRKSITSELEKVNDAIEVIEEMVEIPEEGIPEALLSNAYGIAIIPKVIKAAWVVGGRYGKGIILVRNERGRWGNPCFVRIAGGSVGWQIGVQSGDSESPRVVGYRLLRRQRIGPGLVQKPESHHSSGEGFSV